VAAPCHAVAVLWDAVAHWVVDVRPSNPICGLRRAPALRSKGTGARATHITAAFVCLMWALVLHGRATADGIGAEATRLAAATAPSLPQAPT
jgi:hypothetical protein